MSTPLLLSMPGNEAMADKLAAALGLERSPVDEHRFPDRETLVRLTSDPTGREVAIVCALDRPDAKLLPLLFAAATARELGAVRIGLVAPYLAYMRQDRRFHPGEAISSRHFARVLSRAFDWLVTVDPHLHRYASLAEIYSIPATVVHAAPAIAGWIRDNVRNGIVIGPDSESEQWVAAVAQQAAMPFTVLEKTRRGDRDVAVTFRTLESFDGREPVFVDDIISSGRTMLEAVKAARRLGAGNPLCIGVHGIFAEDADVLLEAEAARVVTANTIPHRTNAVDVSLLLAEAVREILSGAIAE